MSTLNRLAPEHIRQWRKRLDDTRTAFASGTIDETALQNRLFDLGYRSEALTIELNEARDERLRARS